MTQQLYFPLKNIYLTGDRSTHGYPAYDFAWFSSREPSGEHPPLMACGDGVVRAIVNSSPDYPTSGYGNYIIIKYDNGYSSIYAHIKRNSFAVSVGQKVKRGQTVCYMNNSGNSRGSHLHLEICSGEFRSQRGIDCLSVLRYTDSNYIAPDGRMGHTFTKATDESPVSSVSQNVGKNQLHVLVDNLRVRDSAGSAGKVLGFATKGFYNVETITNPIDGYEWAKVDKYYMAISENDSEYKKASVVPVKQNIKVDQIEVTSDQLRIRASSNTSSTIMGYFEKGFYNVSESVKSTDFTWYKVNGYWAAGVENDVVFHEAENADKKKIALLKSYIEDINALNEKIKEVIEKSRAV